MPFAEIVNDIDSKPIGDSRKLIRIALIPLLSALPLLTASVFIDITKNVFWMRYALVVLDIFFIFITFGCAYYGFLGIKNREIYIGGNRGDPLIKVRGYAAQFFGLIFIIFPITILYMMLSDHYLIFVHMPLIIK